MNLAERIKRGPQPTVEDRRDPRRPVPIWIERAQRVGLPIQDNTPLVLRNGAWIVRDEGDAA